MSISVNSRLVLQRQPPIACASLRAALTDQVALSAVLISSISRPARLPAAEITLQGRYERCTKESL